MERTKIHIKKFHENKFGDLTTLVSEKTGKIMFVAKEVAKLWGYSNIRSSIKVCNLDKGEVLTLSRKDYPDFFDIVSNSHLLTKKSHTLQLISESGLYKLALNSKKEEAQKLRDWVTKDILPSIRKTGSYTVGQSLGRLEDHQSISFQKKNSIAVNKENYRRGGVPSVIEYNKRSCLLHVGREPKEIKSWGKSIGLKTNQTNSAKQVLRETSPAMACAMSLTDQMVKQGHSLDKFAPVSVKYGLPLFKAMLEMGAIPGELNY